MAPYMTPWSVMRQRGEFQFMGLVHQPVEAARPVEQRILGVQMKMDKIRMRHAANVRRRLWLAQARSPSD